MPRVYPAKVTLVCRTCKDPFQVIPALRARAKFCGKRCADLGQKERTGPHSNRWKGGPAHLICVVCGEPFTARTSDVKRGYAKCCSTVCRGKRLMHRVSARNAKPLPVMRNTAVAVAGQSWWLNPSAQSFTSQAEGQLERMQKSSFGRASSVVMSD